MENMQDDQQYNIKVTKRTLKKLWQYGLLYKKMILIALALLVVAVSTEVIGPLIAKRMIDEHVMGIEGKWYYVDQASDKTVIYGNDMLIREGNVTLSADVSGLNTATIKQEGIAFYFTDANGVKAKLTKEQLYQFYKPEIAEIIKLSIIYVILILISALLVYTQRRLLQSAANRIVRKLRLDVFGHIHRLPVRYFDNLAAGQVVSRVTNDTESIRELYVNVIANFSTGVIYVAAIFTGLFILDPFLGFMTLPLIPILAVWVYIYRKYAQKYNRILRGKLSEINGTINESIQGMTIIQAFRSEKKMDAEFDELTGQYFKYQNKMLTLNALTTHNLLNVIRNTFFIVVIALLFTGNFGAGITIGVLFAYIDYLNRMFNPIVGMVNQLSNMEVAFVSAERVFRLMDEEGIDVDTQTIPRYRGDVSFESVNFAYKQDEYVLKDINFSAKQGETVALVGHTGSGKSSILNLLFRFYDIEQGTIKIDDVDIKQYSKQQIRRHMGIVLQDPFLFTGTIASNVSLDNPTISREQIVQALKDVGAYDMFMQLPNGIDSVVVEKGATLSAGQRQLISFARALAYNPAILILDEATASIDSETEAIIQDALEVLKRGRTTFVIAHRLSTIREASQILVLDRGRIVERGRHDELIANKGKYYLMYQLQSGHVEPVSV